MAALDDLPREGDALRFDIKVLDALTHFVLRNRLQDPSFEAGNRLPEAWTPESFTPACRPLPCCRSGFGPTAASRSGDVVRLGAPG